MLTRRPQTNSSRHIIEPRPQLTLIVECGFVHEIWVAGQAPLITIHDYDWGETDPLAMHDQDGAPYTMIKWRAPAWRLGLTVNRAV